MDVEPKTSEMVITTTMLWRLCKWANVDYSLHKRETYSKLYNVPTKLPNRNLSSHPASHIAYKISNKSEDCKQSEIDSIKSAIKLMTSRLRSEPELRSEIDELTERLKYM